MKKLLLLLTFISLVCLAAEWDYTGTAYYVGSEDGTPTGLFRYGDYWYLVGNSNDSVYRYDDNWAYTGIAYYIGNEDGGATDIYRDGNYWYMAGNDNDSIFRYDDNWAYTGTAYYVGGQDVTPTGICKDGSYWYMVGLGNDSVYQYDENWAYTGIAYDVSAQDGMPPQIHKYGTYWYMSGYDNDSIFQYDESWSYTGTAYYIGNEDSWPSGFRRYGDYWYMSGNDNDSVYVYEGTPSIPTSPTLIRIFDNAIFNAYPSPYACTLSVSSTDPQSDDIQYEIQWDTDYGFSSASSDTTVTYSSGDTTTEAILLGATPAEAETLFYWRVRARDPGGSNAWSDWSAIRSVTMDMDLGDDSPYWYQVAEYQFDQGTLNNVIVQGNSVTLSSGEGTITSHLIAYADLTAEDPGRSNWNGAKWMKSSADDSIGLQIQYLQGGSWDTIPDSDLPGNSNYLYQMEDSFCNIDLSGLNTTTYDTLRMIARFSSYASAPNPSLTMWALGKSGGITSIPLDDKLNFALYLQNPNILIGKTGITIKYQLPREEKVKIGIFDLLGIEVATLVDERKSRGSYSASWQRRNDYNKTLASGVYFLRMEAGEFQDIKKLVLLR